MRYAVFYAPPADQVFWRLGSDWLGRDAASGQEQAQPALPGVAADSQAALTRAAARYGWHATLKAPFHAAAGIDRTALLAAVADLARGFTPFEIALRVDWLDDFLALRPDAGTAPLLLELATACTVGLQPLTDASRPLPPRPGLSSRQLALYRRWGYPYVFEQYRFHLTLSQALARSTPLAAALEQGARDYFADPVRQCVDGLALFVEPGPGLPLRYLAHCGFDGEVRHYGG
ncbi:DUF1045 domain-containing protein [Paludibacterium purpuratum]|uniref:Uncharacterized protein DUF1045 n=1 Tax=Paludibacterium purpuratum TaxID=1144873 RepID=A0A4R7BD18_9NEIS|nr:DUF1045 domain-containing protein [Paludibacterium purpuratum]TDR82980.1 uncharacterized protein DUF1045 [Paludibacterium purpuratum]